MKLINKILILGFILLEITSCSVTSDGQKDIICTTEYKTIAVIVKYSNGSPVLLDSSVVINKLTGQRVAITEEFNVLDQLKQQGYYPTINDSWKDKLKGENVPFEFFGYLKGVKAVSTTLHIGANDCHIELLSGNSQVTLPNP